MEGAGVLLGCCCPRVCSSSICMLVVRVRALIVLSVGVRYVWVAPSSLSKGGALSSVGGGHRLWAGSLFVGTGLLIVVGGARSHGGVFMGGGLSFMDAVVTCCLLCSHR